MKLSYETVADELPPGMKRKLHRLHKQLDKIEAAFPNGVQPPPVRNRVTGKLHEFGRRRCFDGVWVLELLAHSGVTREQALTARYVLEPLIEHGVKIDADLLELLSSAYTEPSDEEWDAIRRGATLHSDGALQWPKDQFRLIEGGRGSDAPAR